MSKIQKKILVTRPQHQLAEISQLLSDNNYAALAFSSIEICAVNLTPQLKQTLCSINDYDLIIFISANAVQHALKLLQQQNIKLADISASIATIGKATRNAAIAAGFKVDISPQQGFNSESLLALNELQTEQINATRCLIIRGVGGLEHLANTLQQRGAQVNYAEVYQRCIPQFDGDVSRQVLRKNWPDFGINAITVTSNESLQNLYDMLELANNTLADKCLIMNTLIIVASERSVKLAKSLGFKQIYCAQSAINQHILEALNSAFNNQSTLKEN